jgi:hypothetical protein
MCKNERLTKLLQVLKNDYKHTGYYNKYKMNHIIWLSPFNINRWTCTEINSYLKMEGKAFIFLSDIKHFKAHVHMELICF